MIKECERKKGKYAETKYVFVFFKFPNVNWKVVDIGKKPTT